MALSERVARTPITTYNGEVLTVKTVVYPEHNGVVQYVLRDDKAIPIRGPMRSNLCASCQPVCATCPRRGFVLFAGDDAYTISAMAVMQLIHAVAHLLFGSIVSPQAYQTSHAIYLSWYNTIHQ
jgi:hypothetical protein